MKKLKEILKSVFNLETIERASDYYLRMIILVVALVNLIMWASTAKDITASMTFGILSVLALVAMTALGIISFIKARR